MPLKTSPTRKHHAHHPKERRSKKFLKVYAPYIPLLTLVGLGIAMLQTPTHPPQFVGSVKSYATNMSDGGLLDATNKARREAGMSPLNYNGALDQAAQAKAQDMKSKNYWSHISPDGTQPWNFIEQANYSYHKAAENLAFGFGSSNETVTGWMNSPSHRANLLDPELHDVGFGIVNAPNYQGHGEETIVVAMYGQPAGTGVQPSTDSKPSYASVANQEPTRISVIQQFTGGKAPWSTFLIGILSGGILMYLLVKHAHGLRKTLIKSERFIIHHPLLDITLIAFVVVAVIASRTIGSVY